MSPQASAARPVPGLAADWGVIASLWRRDMLHLVRERSRWLGVVLQPLMIWLLLGVGMGSVFQVEGIADLDYLAFFFPGVVVMVVLFTTVFATMAVIEDRQHGFLQQFAVAPAGRGAMVLGKTAGVTTVAVVQAVLCLLVSPLAGYDLTLVHWPALAAAVVLGSIGLTGISFTMAWIVGSTHAYHALMSLVLLPLWMVSGAMFPPQGGPMDVLMAVDPMTYMVDGIRHAMHGGHAPVGFVDLPTALMALVGFAVVSCAVAVATTHVLRRWRP